MNPVRACVERPAATLLVAFGVVVFGLVAWMLLPVASLPQVEYPVINVAASFPGASAETMATAVASPLERQLAVLNGLQQMNSFSSAGNTSIRLRFGLDRSIDQAANDVQAAISLANADLPPDLPRQPSVLKENPADRPVVIMALTSEVMPLDKIDQYADTIVLRQIVNLPGVGSADISDEHKRAIRIEINPVELAARGMSIESVRQAIQHASVNRPKGKIEGIAATTTLEANDQLYDAASFERIAIGYRNGAPVRLSDVAVIEDGLENNKVSGWYNGQPAIVVGVQSRPGANAVATADTVTHALGILRASLPPAVKLDIVTERAETIRAALRDVEWTLVVTIGLVVFVVFLFLRNFWATVIPSVTIPLSLMATFIAMWLLGLTLDNLSLMALAITVGFVVDDAIVVVENIVRHIEAGETPRCAAIVGGSRIAFTILSISLSLVAVFIPVFLMGGVAGRLFREFAITVTVAILASAAISLSLTPMMCSALLRPSGRITSGRLARLAGTVYDRLFGLYRVSVIWVLRHRTLTFVGFAATLGLTGYLYAVVPKGFFPAMDSGRLVGFALAAPETPFAQTGALVEKMGQIIRSDPDVYSLTSYAGIDGENSGTLIVNLKPKNERSADLYSVIARLRASTKNFPGLRLFLQPAPEIVTGTDAGRTEYLYTLTDSDRTELELWAPIMEAKLKTVPGLVDVSLETAEKAPSVLLAVDRELADRLGVDAAAIDDTLYDAYGERRVAEMFTDSQQYYGILEVGQPFRKSMRSLELLHVASRDGRQVPLSTFVHVLDKVSPTTITHRGQSSSETISFNLDKGVSIGTAEANIRAMEQGLTRPIGLQPAFEGAAREFEESLAAEPWLVAAALLVVYIVLGMLYESFVHPLTILSALPSAGVGALLALQFCGSNLDVMGLIGIILLIGIVKKNTIMMVDFAIQSEQEGNSPEAAILQACLVRFRPIMMTTIAAIAGALPLALGHGAGSELRQPLGIAIVGGLVVSQLLTLYTTPVIHLALRTVSLKLAAFWKFDNKSRNSRCMDLMSSRSSQTLEAD